MPSTAEAEGVDLKGALDALAGGDLVAFPTETVWGLAARAESDDSVARMRDFKGRDADKPVSVLVDSPERLASLGAGLGDDARALVDAFWPGPLTLVARCTHGFAPGIAGPNGGIGFRCSSHPVAAALAAGAFERGLGAVTATSFNRSGEEPARTASEAAALAASDARVVLTGGEADGSEPSTVVDATGPTLRILREGAIPARAIHATRAPAEAASR